MSFTRAVSISKRSSFVHCGNEHFSIFHLYLVQVILETSRLATVVNGLLRKTTQDIELNGMLKLVLSPLQTIHTFTCLHLFCRVYHSKRMENICLYKGDQLWSIALSGAFNFQSTEMAGKYFFFFCLPVESYKIPWNVQWNGIAG